MNLFYTNPRLTALVVLFVLILGSYRSIWGPLWRLHRAANLFFR